MATAARVSRLLVVLVVLASAAPSRAAVVHVDVHGSIAAVVSSAAAGDTVVLPAGNFEGVPHCGGAIRSANVKIVGAGPGATVINCTGTGLRGLSITGSGAVLAELAIVGGSACVGGSGGGNILIESPGNAPGFTATLHNVLLQGGVVSASSPACASSSQVGVANGGGLAVYSVANLAMSGLVLQGNAAASSESAEGGGMYFVSWVPDQAVVLNFTDCTLASNSAITVGNTTGMGPGAIIRGAQGGGARVWAGVAPRIDVVMSNSAVTDNMAQCTPNCNGFGGGMAMVGQNASFGSVGSTFTVDASLFDGNKVGGSACASLGGCGGVGGALNTGMVTTISGSTLQNNAAVCSGSLSAAGSACSAAGGAVFAQGVPFTTTSSSYDGNVAMCTGNACGAGGGAIATISASPERFTNVNISNSLSECTGHACQATGAALSVLNYAGGVPSVDVDVSVTSAVMISNVAKATLTSCASCEPGFVYGAIGAAVFAQSVGSGHYTNVSVADSVLAQCQTQTTVSASGKEVNARSLAPLADFPGLSAGGAVFVLAYSGTGVVALSGCTLSGINSTCSASGAQCLAGYPLLAGYGSVNGHIGGTGCVVSDSGSPQLYTSLADYDAGLVDSEFSLDLSPGACEVELSCPFLQRTLPRAIDRGAVARPQGSTNPVGTAVSDATGCVFNATCSTC